ncbi:hypothetical protein MBT84_47120 [Streptomyces sp. MBT84]|nr:hypothetical protein [Streptomyces sp. MBT84]
MNQPKAVVGIHKQSPQDDLDALLVEDFQQQIKQSGHAIAGLLPFHQSGPGPGRMLP